MTERVTARPAPSSTGTTPPSRGTSSHQSLNELFRTKRVLVRDDLIRKGLCTRENANSVTAEWVRQGVIVQTGMGRSTEYRRGPALREVVGVSTSSSPNQSLIELFRAKPVLVRADLIRKGLCTRENANSVTAEWQRAGLIVQTGYGKTTEYRMGAALQAEMEGSTRARPSHKPSRDKTAHKTNRVAQKSNVFARLFKAIGRILKALFA